MQFCWQNWGDAVSSRDPSKLTRMNEIVIHRMMHELSVLDCPDSIEISFAKVEGL